MYAVQLIERGPSDLARTWRISADWRIRRHLTEFVRPICVSRITLHKRHAWPPWDRWAGAHTEVVTSSLLRLRTDPLARDAALSLVVVSMLLPTMAIGAWTYGRGPWPEPMEFGVFGPAGARILTGQWGAVFDNSKLQAGPFEVIPVGAATALHVSGVVGWTLFYLACTALLAWGLAFTALVALRTFGGGARQSHTLTASALGTRTLTSRALTSRVAVIIALAVTALGLLTSVLPRSLSSGHPAEIAIPLSWIVAACLACDRRFALCGVVVALSAGWEVWGVLGAPVIFLAANPRLIRAAVGGLVTLLVIYGPFVAAGNFHMFEFHWTISSQTLVHELWPQMTEFPWILRLAQAALALGTGVAVAIFVRRTPYGVWLVPMSIVAVRLLCDPLLYGYYFLVPAVVATCATGLMLWLRSWIGLVVAVLVLVSFVVDALVGLTGAITLTVGCVVAALLIGLVEKRRKRGPDEVSRLGARWLPVKATMPGKSSASPTD